MSETVVIGAGSGGGTPGVDGAPGAGYLATSTSSVAIGTGSKSFTTQSGLAYSVGARVRVSDASTPTNYVEGLCTAYSGTTLTILATVASGSGTIASWDINLAGDVGATGATGAAGSNGTNGTNGTNGAAGAGYAATSTSSIAIATGSKSFTTQSGLAYSAGARVRASDSSNGANFVEGLCTSYSGTTLVINVTLTGGSGTIASWNINVSGESGSSGSTVTAVSPYIGIGSGFMGPIHAVTKPPDVSTLTFLNQGGATATTLTNGALLLMAPTNSGDSVRFLRLSAYPSTPYTFTIGMLLAGANADAVLTGVAISNGTKVFIAGPTRVSSLGMGAYTFTTLTTNGGSQITQSSFLISNPWFVSITDDGTNITVSGGPSLDAMQVFTTTTRSALGITPTQLGIAIDNSNTGLKVFMEVFHWLVA